jgi:hypothetical protein
LYSSNIIRMVKSRRIRWAGNVARKGEMRNVFKICIGKPDGKRPLLRPRRRYEDNIRMDLVKRDGRMWTGFVWFRTGTMTGCCEHDNEPLGSAKGGYFHDQLNDYQLLRKDSATSSWFGLYLQICLWPSWPPPAC